MMKGSDALNITKINEVYMQAKEATDNLVRILQYGNCISRILCPVLCTASPPDNSNQSRAQRSGFKFFFKKKTKAKQAASQRSHMALQATLPSPPIAEDSTVVYDLPYWPSNPSARSSTLPCRVRKHSPPTGSSTLPSRFSRVSCKEVWPIPRPPAIPAPTPPTNDAGTAVPFTVRQPKADIPQHHSNLGQGSSSHHRQGSDPQHHSHLRHETKRSQTSDHSHLRQDSQHHSHLRQGSDHSQGSNPQQHFFLRQGGRSHSTHNRVYPRPVSLGKVSSNPPPEESGSEDSGSEEYICHVCRGEANSTTYMNTATYMNVGISRPSSALPQMSDKESEGYYMNIH